MTCNHCCGADKLFNYKKAKSQLKKYRKKGPLKTSRNLIDGIKSVQNGSSSLLDIGGGIGAVHLELIKEGISSVTNIDASSSYLELAKEESGRQGASDKITYFQGDFLDHAIDLEKHDIVVLDKVICCYPSMPDLLKASISKSEKILALVYPKNNVLGRAIISFANFVFKMKRNSFRIFLHSNEEIRNQINQAGFQLASRKTVYPWNIEVYQRII